MTAFGFRNDLSRLRQPSPGAVLDALDSTAPGFSTQGRGDADGNTLSFLRPECQKILTNVMLYQAGLEASDASVKAIARQVCTGNQILSTKLIYEVCCFSRSDYYWNLRVLID